MLAASAAAGRLYLTLRWRWLTLALNFAVGAILIFAMALVVGAEAARNLAAARDAGFSSWEQIDAVAGMGGERLLRLQAACEIRLGDGGVW